MSLEDRIRPFRQNCPRLDHDHEVLFTLIDRLESFLEDQGDPTSLDRLLVELGAYFDAHFENEEQLMEATGFPELAEHRDEHTRMGAVYAEFVAKLRSDPDCNATAILADLKNWVRTHIAETDERLAKHLGAAGIDDRMGLYQIS